MKQRVNGAKRWVFEKISKIDKPLFKLTKRKRDKIQINKIRNEKGDITSDTEEIRSHFKILYLREVENVKEMDNFLLCFKPSEGIKQAAELALFVSPT